MKTRILSGCRNVITAGLLASLVCTAAASWDGGIVEKKSFTLPSYTTANGATIKNLTMGWEAYGELNQNKDNVVLIGHFFSANSHAAGKYKLEDKTPGYWSSIIGPGKAIDTNKYYVVSVDSLVNLNSKDGITVTTGPASVNPDTGKPYGMDFPLVTFVDFVRVQKALLDSLGIQRLRMVGGPSMGALVGFEWAAAYPNSVERVLAVVGVPVQDPFAMVELGRWALPVRMDPNWKSGNYYGGLEPIDGVTQGFVNISVGARHPEFVRAVFGYRPTDVAKSPADSVLNSFQSESAIFAASRTRAVTTTDANHLLYMTRANQLFVPSLGSSVDPELKKIKAKVLMIPARTDLLFPPDQVRTHYEKLKANGNKVDYMVLDTPGGHIGGITDIAKAEAAIRAFLDH